ncbi:hypothetical protein, conserved [Plasmodium gonderi]|uniref:Uncharacterized protein n=1 Tax=Plasmodium gonderi TaxID=77519 RepID=A0A1Y1JLD8_PLAGO|nr:hypothetical protein, conserved [Plasmodium gonderi]GAW82275.1 hypothetical protein, conserved [Plasmodium gonderi]
MTDFKTATNSLDEIKNICNELLIAKEEDVYNKLSLYHELEHKLKKLEPIITRIRLRRNEKNEEKKIYGEKMIKNVDILLERYDLLYNIYEEELTVFKENCEIEKKYMTEKKLLQEQQRKEYEKELLNRGRIKTKMEEQEIQKQNEQKMKFLKDTQDEYAQRINRIETIKQIIKEKCNFLYDEISAACDRSTVVAYIYTQLGSPLGTAPPKERPLHVANIEDAADVADVADVADAADSADVADAASIAHGGITADTSNNTNHEHLIDCLYLIYKHNEFKLFKEALKNIIEYLTELVKNIDNDQLKLINLMNEKFQKNILSKKGTLFLFILIGYVVKKPEDVIYVLQKINRQINEKNIYIYLEEPDIATDYEKWKTWYDYLQSSLDILCTFFRYVNKYSDVPEDHKVRSIFLYLKEKFVLGHTQ